MSRRYLRVHGTRLRSAVPLIASCFLTSLSIGAYSSEASAQEDPSAEPMKVLVGNLSGAKTTSAREWIVAGLSQDPRFEPVGGDGGAGLKTGASESSIGEAALGLEADAVILGRSRFGNKGWSAELEIYDGKTGALIEKVDIPGGSFQKYEEALTSGEAFFPVILKAEGFPPPAPEVEEEAPVDLGEEEPAPEEEAPPEEEARPSPLDVSLGARLYGRAFRYTDTLDQLAPGSFDPLIDYNLDAAPMPFLGAHWYPAAHSGGGIASHLGITGGYERGIATKVRYTDADNEQITFAQTHQLWYVGARVRIPASIATMGLGANYGSHTFALKDTASGSPSGLFPNVNYSFVELGGDVELKIGEILIGAQGAYLLTLGVGEIGSEEWFPNAKAQGVHFGGHVGWAASRAVDLLAGVDARMYGFNFNPVDVNRPDDRVAGGATDRYVSAWLALRFKIPGSDGAAAAADEEKDEFDDF